MPNRMLCWMYTPSRPGGAASEVNHLKAQEVTPAPMGAYEFFLDKHHLRSDATECDV